MKKETRKILSNIIPKSNIKEFLKLCYFNISTPRKVSFLFSSLKKEGHHHCRYNRSLIKTNIPLYYLYKDFGIYTHFYEPKKDDVVLDIGANIGVLALYFSTLLNDDGRIYTIEPDPQNINKLNFNLSLNSSLSPKVEIDNSLIWNENTAIEFHQGASVASSVFYKAKKAKTVTRDAVTLDSWVEKKKLEKVSFIKMDIEGAEVEAIEGAMKTIEKYQPNFSIASYHIINGKPTYLKVEELFESINYPYKTVKFNDTEIITFAGPALKETLQS